GLPLFSYAATADNATQDPVLVVGSGDLSAPAGFHPSTPTPAGAPAATPTPTPPAGVPQRIEVDVARYAFTPGTGGPIQVTAGNPTTLHFSSSDGTHGFSGISELGINGTNVISQGSYDPYGGGGNPVSYTVTFTAPASARGQTYAFRCTANPTCGTGHDTMLGTLHVN